VHGGLPTTLAAFQKYCKLSAENSHTPIFHAKFRDVSLGIVDADPWDSEEPRFWTNIFLKYNPTMRGYFNVAYARWTE